MRRLALAPLAALLACGLPPELATSAEAPLTGQDRADRACQVVLREVHAAPVDGGLAWLGSLELASALAGARAAVLAQVDGGAWVEVPATAAPGARAGWQRYTFPLAARAAPARIALAPFARLADGSRLFDHNRNPGDFDDSALAPGNGFAIADDPAVCADPAPHQAALRFPTGWTQAQSGALVAGGEAVIDYDLYRLPGCMSSTYNGLPAWDTLGYLRFEPGGQLATGSVKGGLWRVPIPQGATAAAAWFFTSGAHCSSSYDSNFGANYRFVIEGSPPPPVAWAGNLGGSFDRACNHLDGLPEPVGVTSWTLQRACMFIDADVYLPGVTDGAALRPELISAQAEVSQDGAPGHQWMGFVGRFGNNYRYRWQIERRPMTTLPWTSWRYAIRFSTDGVNWTRLAQPNGAARTLLHQ